MGTINGTGDVVRVKDLMDKLSQFDPQLPVKIDTPAGGSYSVELRELIKANRDDVESVTPAVCIFGSNGGRFGYAPLDYETRWDILKDFERGRKFTGIHGDCRMYSPSMGSQATCYGTAYDPRLFLRLAEEGYLRRHNAVGALNDLYYTMTGAGSETLRNG